MNPLLFLAIAVVVPLLGMIVLGVGARIKHQQVTDDETEPFRRRLESIAPPDAHRDAHEVSPSGTPGLAQAMRRRRSQRTVHKAPGEAVAASDVAGVDANAGTHAAAPASPAAGDDGERHRGRRRDRRAARRPSSPSPARRQPAPVRIRLVERDYSVPSLPPLSADLEELPQSPESGPRHRPAAPRPHETPRRYDRVISPGQRRPPGS